MSKEREALLKIASEMHYSKHKFTNNDILFVLKNINWKMFKNSLPNDELIVILVEATTK
jgi:hypothetical protein